MVLFYTPFLGGIVDRCDVGTHTTFGKTFDNPLFGGLTETVSFWYGLGEASGKERFMLAMGLETGGVSRRVMSLAFVLAAFGMCAFIDQEPPEAIEPALDTEIEWITIGDINNPPIEDSRATWRVIGRGSVGYRYRISKYEVTTAQWMEFVNTFSTQGGEMYDFARPTFWGARTDEDYTGSGRRYVLRNEPNAAMMPVFGITWREAAQYCNWLHNNKSSSLDAIADGAYDTSTFGENQDNTFTDQHTRSPGARFWIPSWDEWLKAAHYYPEIGIWQKWPTTRNRKPIPGMPGLGETSAGITFDECKDLTFCEFDIPLGAYDTVSPYGLHDLSGGTAEWTEEVINHGFERLLEGLYAGRTIPDNFLNGDAVFIAGESSPPWSPGAHGLRIGGVAPIFLGKPEP
jgi:sulfatase-modifying factor enzyme 1